MVSPGRKTQPLPRRFASRLLGGYVWLLRHTGREEIMGRDKAEAAHSLGKGLIFAFWHNRLALAPCLLTKAPAPVHMLVSANRDGDTITAGIKLDRLHFVRGSAANPRKTFKGKGGASALYQMIDILARGDMVGITPDGPRGPAEQVQPGVIRLAALSGAPIIPAGFAARRMVRLDTWDRFQVAVPFAAKVFVGGDPIHVPEHADETALEAARLRLETALREVSAQADRQAGKNPSTRHG